MQHAFVDESEPLGTGNGGPYVMVATLPLVRGEEGLEALREVLRRTKPDRATKLHWYDSTRALRDETVAAIAAMPLVHRAVVVQPQSGDRPERLRRTCMERLLWEVDTNEAVMQVTFESRGEAGDRRDMKMIQALRAGKVITSRMRFTHVRGADEPLLWLPDAVCGAVNGRLTGRDFWAARLDHQLRFVS